jgi:hypothetical protein
MFSSKNKAVATIQMHFELFHKDFLPFGITNKEALKLINEIDEDSKPIISKLSKYSVQTADKFKNKTTHSQSVLEKLLGEDVEVCHKWTSEKAQLIT